MSNPFYFYTLGRHVAQGTLQIYDLTVLIQLNNTAQRLKRENL